MSEPVRASRRKYHIIYKTTCLVTGRYYIGMHSTNDLNDSYLGSGVRLKRSIKKHGKEQHIREILEQLPSRQAASDREKELITEELRADPMCLNCGVGGLGAVDRPPTKEETRQKLSEKGKAAWAEGRLVGMTGKVQTSETIQKRVQKLIGKKRTAEQVAKVSKGLQAYHAEVDPQVISERAQRAAKTREERGTNLGGRPRGIPMTEEQKLALSNKTKGKELSEEHKLNLKKPKVRICCVFCQKETTTSHLPRYHSNCT